MLSVVAPAYNEQENIRPFVEEICEALADLDGTWEIVIADDLSDDATGSILRELMDEVSQLRVLTMTGRSGQTAALDAAMRAARGQYIATLDADLQNDPHDIPKMLEMIRSGRCDFVNGWRRNRHDAKHRLFVSKFGNKFRNWLTGNCVTDSGCGIKVFKAECIERIKWFNGMHRFFATLVQMEGYEVSEIEVNHRARAAGQSKYGFFNRFFRFVRDAMAVRWMRKRLVNWRATEVSAASRVEGAYSPVAEDEAATEELARPSR